MVALRLLAVLIVAILGGNGLRNARIVSRNFHLSMGTALEGVKNLRDLSTAITTETSDLGVGITHGRVIRTGCPSKATEKDRKYLLEECGLKDLIDLRSPKEWRQDENLFRNPMYDGYKNYRFSRMARNWIKLDGNTTQFNIFTGSGLEEVDDMSASQKKQNRRYFVPLMNTRRIMWGTFKRFRKRTKLLFLPLTLLSVFSKRAKKRLRGLFIDKLNGGGLSLLNEILLDSSGHEIVAVMKLLSTNEDRRAALYCTAGKDRTGLIVALTLSVLGASDNDIITDYVKSDGAYANINSKEAMVMAMEQKDIDPDVFLRAPSYVMRDTLSYVRQRYGGVNKYLNSYGFNDVWRNKLRNNLLFG